MAALTKTFAKLSPKIAVERTVCAGRAVLASVVLWGVLACAHADDDARVRAAGAENEPTTQVGASSDTASPNRVAPGSEAATATHRVPEEAPREGLDRIDPDDLRTLLAAFAADSMEGRRAGTAGDRRAAAFLAAELERLDVAPAGPDGSYLQRFAIAPPGSSLADSSQNVVGLIPGSDPALADEVVALGAHFDHLGVGSPVGGDSIYNGADDDGSGTVSLLELVEALSLGPRPRRSVMVVFHGAEEAGLLGSQHLTTDPPMPLDSIVAQLNLDMLGRNSPDSLFVIGAGRISSELDDIVRRQAQAAGLALDYTLDAEDHPERLYYRSDHYSYARHGIPVAFFFAGLHPDYHQPSDEIEKIDFEKLERAAELVYRVTWEVANQPEPLARDRFPESPSG